MSKKKNSTGPIISGLSSVEAEQSVDKERTARLSAIPAFPKKASSKKSGADPLVNQGQKCCDESPSAMLPQDIEKIPLVDLGQKRYDGSSSAVSSRDIDEILKKSSSQKETQTTRSRSTDIAETNEPIPEISSTPPRKSRFVQEKQTMLSHPSFVYMNAPTLETSSDPSSTSLFWKRKQTTFSDLSVADEMKKPETFEERCRQLALALFLDRDTDVQSLGITSAIAGEGKSFIAVTLAQLLAKAVKNPVTLLECNWEHPCIHEYFSLPAEPGLAEWLRGECEESVVRHQIRPNFTVIPAGNGRGDAVKLLQLLQGRKIVDSILLDGGFLLVDLPPVINVAYGVLAASIVEDLLLVVHTGATTHQMVTEMLYQLKDLHIQGVILNQMKSRIPRWISWIF